MPQVIAAALAAVLILIAGIFLGRLVFPAAPSTPSTTSAEAGFARDMQVHHQQAIEMSTIIREKSDNEEIRTLAYDIATSQGQQVGQMFGWLTMWKLPQASAEPSMTWMTQPTLDGTASDMDSVHISDMPGMSDMTMMGMATFEQMEELKSSADSADRIFLELMIAHHAGGVEMAQALLERSTDEVVTSLAEKMVLTQENEIHYMNEILASF